MVESCTNCKFSWIEETGFGCSQMYCRRNPPSPFTSFAYPYPKTYDGQWCGEYKSNEPPL